MSEPSGNVPSTAPAGKHCERRVMLALIALSTDLPMPKAINFIDGSAILSLDLGSVGDGQVWAAHLGATTKPHIADDIRYLGAGSAGEWHGWTVHLHASEPAAADAPLDGDTTARLTALAAEDGVQ
jgi:hypothetical protein